MKASVAKAEARGALAAVLELRTALEGPATLHRHQLGNPLDPGRPAGQVADRGAAERDVDLRDESLIRKTPVGVDGFVLEGDPDPEGLGRSW